ncbi:Uncharacterised protein [Serratia marcescens]|nr:Uncharacterised protein [Serratia marcescens]
MNVYEMEGFLRGQCVPRDLLVNESIAAYLVRKLSEIASVKAERDALADRVKALAVENAGFKRALSVILEHVDVTDKGQAGVVAMIANDELFNSETPATDAALAAIRTESHIAGVEAAANRIGVISLKYNPGQKHELIKAIGREVIKYATELREAK